MNHQPSSRRYRLLDEALAQQGLTWSPRPGSQRPDSPLRTPSRELEREEARERLRRFRERRRLEQEERS